jgi:hypothetical protein
MASATATFYEVPCCDPRVFFFADIPRITRAIRGVAGGGATGVAALAAVGLFGTLVTFAAAFILNTTIAGNPHLRAPALTGPAALAIAPADANPLGAPAVSFEAKWAGMAASLPAGAVPLLPQRRVEFADNVPTPPPRPNIELASRVPLPLARPAQPESVPPSATAPAPHIAAVLSAPAVAKPAKPQEEAHNKSLALPAADSRTAVYDISARAVYLPNGERLEAHSGLGDKMDDPRFVKVRMRGPTPPNVYDLTLREDLFHGVRAIRLNPLDDDKMFGRAGMLAHPYMLGANGQSNGCVSFSDYDKFLHAFLKGEVDRMVVVAHLDTAPRVARVARKDDYRYAANY